MKRILSIIVASLLLLIGCRTAQEVAVAEPQKPVAGNVWGVETQPVMAVRSVIVYKTRADYSNLVPVTLDPSATKIVSYPDPSDVSRMDGSYFTPTPLDNGYWLDNRGVGRHSAFLNYTYEEYAALDSLPSLDEMMDRIVDKHPFVEMWNCGKITRFENLIPELNKLVNEGFIGCQNIIYEQR